MIFGLADFAGQWQLSRQITDHAGGQDGRLVGQAQFQQQGQGCLHYQEQGQLQLGAGPVMAAQRAYIWRFGKDSVDVCFADDTPFHSFVPSGQAPGTDHPCGKDFYTVQYDFRRMPEWEAVWRVHGPRKDYTSVSRYSR